MMPSRDDQLSAARALLVNHQYAAAGAILADLLLKSPGDFEGWMLAAQLHLHVRDLERAFSAVSKAVMLRPNDPNALYTLGRVHKARGELGDAESCYRRAIELNPLEPNTLTSLGVLLRSSGRLDEAVELYRRALEIAPNHTEAKLNLGNALAAAGVAGEALTQRESARTALAAELERMRAAAASLIQQANLQDAFAVLKGSLRIAPNAADIWLRAGELAVEMGMLAESLPYLEEAFRLDPRSRRAVELAWRVCFVGGLREPAMRYADLARELVGSEEISIASKLFLPAIEPSVEAIQSTRRQYEQGLEDVLNRELQPSDQYYKMQPTAFYLAYHGENNRDLQIKAARMYLKLIPDLQMTASHCFAPTRRPGKIRVGFISKFLRSHSIGKTTRGLVERLDRDRFEIYALRIAPSAEDDTTRLICAAADHALTLDVDVPRAREQIASLGLDILFYQDIGLEPTSYFLSFARLAHVQCVSFGHPDTTGVPNMDYFVSNDLFEAPQAASHYSERLFLLHDLPTLAYYYKPLRKAAVNRGSFGLPADANIYLCPQTLFKLHPDFDDLIARILRRDPKGLVVLIEGLYPQWTGKLQQRFAISMPDVADRVIFLASVDLNIFLELLSVADVILDSIHFNGMNSSLEAFAVGTPVVTLPTNLQRGRHTQAMYKKMGILDCIAGNKDDYVDLAVSLGADRSYAHEMRSRIIRCHDVLFENPCVTREFERFFVDSLREKLGAAI